MSDYETVRTIAIALLESTSNLNAEDVRPKVEVAINTVSANGYKIDIDPEKLISELESNFNTFVSNGTILEDPHTGHLPWLPDRHSEIDWKFSRRYHRFLKTRTNMSVSTLTRSDDLTNRILGLLGDPKSDMPFDRRGLAVGQVQSGKTSNYIDLICKATDAGYKLIVILTGSTNDLRSQTQLRVDQGFLGWDTRHQQKHASGNTRTGVGTLVGESLTDFVVQSLTSSAERGDFNLSTASGGGYFLGGDPFILTVKKNVSVLNNLVNWIKEINPYASGQQYNGLPFLLIDDEADWGSLNTRRSDEDPTAINRAIRQLLDLFSASSYVGYTATPFANIFISTDRTVGEYGEDLFPRDFLISLPTPSSHLGPAKVFGLRSAPGLDIEPVDPLPLVVTVDDYLDSIPDVHRKDLQIIALPDSLMKAIKAFVLVCAARTARGQNQEHNSMLVHVTRFVAVQKQVTELVDLALRDIQNRLRYGDGDNPINLLDDLQEIWEDEFRTTSQKIKQMEPELTSECNDLTWQDLLPHLVTSSQKIQVRGINGAAKDVLDYTNYPNGLSTIAIGGDKLSRGLTLEGLSISYYLRSSKMYDTLLQMGRWFGYRPGYVDLCRLYTSVELKDNYTGITMVSEELRQDFEYMADIGGTPSDFGLKVRTHPGLGVTAANKMRNGTVIPQSYSGHIPETILFDRNTATKNRVRQLYERFLSEIYTKPNRDDSNNVVWTDVKGVDVANLLRTIPIPKDTRKVNGPLLSEYIKSQLKEGGLTNWTVVLISNRDGSYSDNIAGHTFFPLSRAQFPEKIGDLAETYRIRRLLNPSDEMIDLTSEQRSEALTRTIQHYESQYRNGKTRYQSVPTVPGGPQIRRTRSSKRGLLLIYPLRYQEDVYFGFGISFPFANVDTPVEYVVNSVYYEQELAVE